MIDELRRCGEGVAPEVGAMLEAYHGNVGRDRPGAYVHDAMALAVLVWPELFDIRAARLTVVPDSGPGRGRPVDAFASAEPNAALQRRGDGKCVAVRAEHGGSRHIQKKKRQPPT